MRRIILAATTIAALAVPAIAPALASASVQRNQMQTGTLAVHVGHLTDPGSESTHYYPNVTINPCGDSTFSATDGYGRWTSGGETINGKTVDGKVTEFRATMWDGGYQWSYDPTQIPTWQGFDGYQRFSVDSIALNVTDSTHYKNHGDYVSQNPDKDDAAHSCIGMPINSSK